MKYINTLPQSRSFNRPWLSLDANIGVISGVIVSIQITTTSDSPIYVAGLDVSDGLLSMSLRQNDLPFASLITDQSNTTMRMTAEHVNCVSAIVHTGSLEGITDSYRGQTAKIRRCFVYVQPADFSTTQTYDIVIDGVLHRYTDTVALEIDTTMLSYQKSDLGTVTVSMSAMQKNQFNRVSTDAETIDDTLITSINGITPNAQGELSIGLSYDTYGVVPLTRVNDHLIAIETADTTHIPACDVEDYVNIVLSPANVRDFTKMPLDDAYTTKQSGDTTEYIRNYALLEQRKYALYTGSSGLSLYERNPLHDS